MARVSKSPKSRAVIRSTRKPSKRIAPPGGRTETTEAQYSLSQKLYYRVIEDCNPIQSQIDGFNNFCDVRIDMILASQEVRGETVQGWTSYYKLEKRGIVARGNIKSAYEASLEGITISNDCNVCVVRTWRNSKGEYFKVDNTILEERSNEFVLFKIPIMIGSKYDRISNENERFRSGDNPALPRGFFIIKGRKKQIIVYHTLKYDLPLIYPKSEGVATSVTCTTPSLGTYKITVLNVRPSMNLLCTTSKLSAGKNHIYLPLYEMMKVLLDLISDDEWAKIIKLPTVPQDEPNYAIISSVINSIPRASRDYSSLDKYLDTLELDDDVIMRVKELMSASDFINLDEHITNMILDYIPHKYEDECRSILELNHSNSKTTVEILNILIAESKYSDSDRVLQQVLAEEIYPMIPMTNIYSKAQQLAYMGSMQTMYLSEHLLPQDRNSRALNRQCTPEVAISKLFADKYRAAMNDIRNNKTISDISKSQEYTQQTVFDPRKAFISIAAIASKFQSNIDISECLVTGFTKGNFGSKAHNTGGNIYGKSISKTGTAKQRGSVADLDAPSLAQAYSALSKCGIPSSSKGKDTGSVRSLHPSSIGYQDLYRSPDDEMIGLILFMSASSYVSIARNPNQMINYLSKRLNPERSITEPNVVFVNGIKQGYADGKALIKQIQLDRIRDGPLSEYVDSMAMYDPIKEEIFIMTDAARMTRPLLVVNDYKLVIDSIDGGWTMDFNTLIKNGAIRMVDAYEVEYYGNPVAQEPGYFYMRMQQIQYLEDVRNTLLERINAGDTSDVVIEIPNIIEAIEQGENYKTNYRRGAKLTPPQQVTVNMKNVPNLLGKISSEIEWLRKVGNYAYCEIDADAIYGYSTGLVPYANRNAATKIAYASHLLTQAIGTGDKNHVLSTDPTILTLNKGQRPLVDTAMSRIVGTNVLPASQNVRMAIITDTSHGMYGGGTQEDAFQVKKEAIDRGLFSYTYHKQILFHPSTKLSAKISRPTGSEYEQHLHKNLDTNGIIKKGTMITPGTVLMSIVYHSGSLNPKRVDKKAPPDSKGIVTDIYYIENPVYVKICFSDNRRPVVGSKISTMHGNKGLIGSITAEKDMPKDVITGIAPDIIINPAGIGKRGTTGFIIEMVTGMAAALKGQRMNACGMDQNFRVESVSYILSAAGLNPDGSTQLVDPRTNEKYPCLTSVGMVQMQILRQTMEEACNVRGSGADRMFSGQPIRGKKNAGGIRSGEMEMYGLRYNNVTYASTSVYSYSSDGTTAAVCTECKNLATSGIEGKYSCLVCDARQRRSDNLNIQPSAITRVSVSGSMLYLGTILSGRGIMPTFKTISM